MPEWQVKLQAWANEVYGAPKVSRGFVRDRHGNAGLRAIPAM